MWGCALSQWITDERNDASIPGSLKDSSDQAVGFGAFAIYCTDYECCDDTRQCSAEDVSGVVGPDIDAGEGDKAGRRKESKSEASGAVKEKSGRNRKGRRRMIGGKRKVGAPFDQ
jgi:hypothetical protein